MMSSAVGAGQAENPRLKMLAVASTRRLPSIPNVPTMAEAGVSGVDQTAWLCVFGPPGVPDAIRERIAREVVAIAHDPAYQAKFRNTGFEPLGLDAASDRADVSRRGRRAGPRSSRSADLTEKAIRRFRATTTTSAAGGRPA